jgi:hydrogenase maturation factor HypE
LFDIRVIDTDAPSYLHRDVASVLSSAEEEKKRKYNDAAEARRASFTPLVVSVDGVLGREAEWFIQLLADKIAQKWKKNLC